MSDLLVFETGESLTVQGTGEICPDCCSFLVHQEGCTYCPTCGFSACS